MRPTDHERKALIEMDLRHCRLVVPELPPVRSFAMRRRGARVPSLQRVVILATFVNERTGDRRPALYSHTIDRSRYTPERLRELRRTRR